MPAGRRQPRRPFSTRRVRQSARWARYLIRDDPSSSSHASYYPSVPPPRRLAPLTHFIVHPAATRHSSSPGRALRGAGPNTGPTLAVEEVEKKPPGMSKPVAPVFAFVVWRRRREIRIISETQDLSQGCTKVLRQFNKKLARLHYLLMFMGVPDKGTKKLHDELAINRRGCMEMCWHIRDNLFAKMTRAALQGEAMSFVRTLSDCLEMYSKELAILSHMHHTDDLINTSMQISKRKIKARGQKVAPTNNQKSEELQTNILDSERQEVQELLQMILNKLTARLETDNAIVTDVEEPPPASPSAMVSIRKAIRPSRLLMCFDCSCAKEYQ